MNKRLIIFIIIGFAVTAAALAFAIGYIDFSGKPDEITETKEDIITDEIPYQKFTAAQKLKVDANAVVRYTIIPESPAPGEPLIVGVNTNEVQALLVVNGRQIGSAKFFDCPPEDGKPGFKAAFMAIPSTARIGSASIKMINEWGAAYEIPFTIAPRTFRTETLHLNPSLTALITEPDPQKTIEAEKLWSILAATGSAIYHPGKFVMPINSTRRTSIFGTRRVHQYSDGRTNTAIHAGVDFGAPLGTEVYACATGLVKLARHRIVTGNTIIIEHAPGMYSLYYHLDEVISKEDSFVKAGDLIGLVGSTGFSTGPHLHWELRIATENTDPDIFISRPVIDKDLIISKIYDIEADQTERR